MGEGAHAERREGREDTELFGQERTAQEAIPHGVPRVGVTSGASPRDRVLVRVACASESIKAMSGMIPNDGELPGAGSTECRATDYSTGKKGSDEAPCTATSRHRRAPTPLQQRTARPSTSLDAL